jgi:hypothetical protein
MTDSRYFNAEELLKVDEAVKTSEDLVSNYFKMSSAQWLKNKYDIKTARDLAPHERVKGPFAQVIKYEGHEQDIALNSSSFSFYKVCLQDPAILHALDMNDGLLLFAFLLYIVTHELVHIVRFSKFEQRYENKNESDVTMEEERKVHKLTHIILEPAPILGMGQVFDFYKDWLIIPEN